jgi:hypothetical protein
MRALRHRAGFPTARPVAGTKRGEREMRMAWRALVVICLVVVAAGAVLAAEEAAKSPEPEKKPSFPWKGFTVKEGDYSMTFGVQLQGLFTYLDEDFDFSGSLYDGTEDTDIDPITDFSMRRARISLTGGAFAPWFKYKLEVDFGLGRTRATDLYVDMDFSDYNRWRVGQFKKPYDLFDLYSSKTLMFIERPAANVFITPANRDIGVMYRGNTKDKRFNWAAMVGNGNGPNTSVNDGALLLGARFEFQNEGGFKYLATAIEHPEKLEYTVGVAYQSNPRSTLVGDVAIDDGETEPEPIAKSSDDYPCVIGTSRSCTWDNRSRDNIEFFGALRGKIFQINATYQMESQERAAADKNGDDADIDLDAYTLEAGIFVTPKWEIAGRYDQLKFKDAVDVTFGDGSLISDFKLRQWNIGTNYYLFQNNLKLMFNYGNITETYDDDAFVGSGKYERSIDTFLAMIAFYI